MVTRRREVRKEKEESQDKKAANLKTKRQRGKKDFKASRAGRAQRGAGQLGTVRRSTPTPRVISDRLLNAKTHSIKKDV